jgi:hypothetical protein
VEDDPAGYTVSIHVSESGVGVVVSRSLQIAPAPIAVLVGKPTGSPEHLQTKLRIREVSGGELVVLFEVLLGAIRTEILDQTRPDVGISREDQQRLVDSHRSLLAVHVLYPPGIDTVHGGVVHRIYP